MTIFSALLSDGTKRFIKEIPQSAFRNCTLPIFEPDHYREDYTYKYFVERGLI